MEPRGGNLSMPPRRQEKKITQRKRSESGFAITEEMRKTQLKLHGMRKYQMLVNEKQEQQEEGKTLHYKLEGQVALEHFHEIESKLEEMRTKLKNDRTQRWRSW
eukprot:15401424-Heterocapsa_arctica.AAC.1